jgi:hypothetical protein
VLLRGSSINGIVKKLCQDVVSIPATKSSARAGHNYSENNISPLDWPFYIQTILMFSASEEARAGIRKKTRNTMPAEHPLKNPGPLLDRVISIISHDAIREVGADDCGSTSPHWR